MSREFSVGLSDLNMHSNLALMKMGGSGPIESLALLNNKDLLMIQLVPENLFCDA